jgi:hypothetical protein
VLPSRKGCAIPPCSNFISLHTFHSVRRLIPSLLSTTIMPTPAPPASTSQLSNSTLSPFKRPWFKKDMKNNALVHSITVAKALQDASDLTGVPFLKSVVAGFVIILENVQVRFLRQSRLRESSQSSALTVRGSERMMRTLRALWTVSAPSSIFCRTR